ncbi:MAG: hypothetical protein FJY92_04905 [Candidatus Hydrogenedentes bacterium]|nr:hypothetical protein [Candidatus Hydrogenedentota bacterium]
MSIPVPIPHHSQQRVQPGDLRIVDCETNANIPNASLIMIRREVPRGGPTPYVAANLIDYHDGDDFAIYTDRGLRIGVGEEIANWQSRTVGFLIIVTGYLPAYYPVDRTTLSSDDPVIWSISKGTREQRAAILSELRRQLEAKPIESASSSLHLATGAPGEPMPECKIGLSFWEIRRFLKYLDGLQDLQ